MEFTAAVLLQILDWIRDVGEQYLASHTTVGSSLEETQALLREHNEFKSASKVELETTLHSLQLWFVLVFVRMANDMISLFNLMIRCTVSSYQFNETTTDHSGGLCPHAFCCEEQTNENMLL